MDTQSGEATPAWRMFLLCLWRRTGETAAPAIGLSVADLIALGKQPSVVVVPTGSPLIYTAPSSGVLIVSGGGVVAMTVQRGSGAAVAVGQFYAGHRLTSSDTVTLTYVAAPVVTFFPG